MAISFLSMKNGLSLTRDSRRDGLELVGGRWKVELPFPGVCVGVSMEGRWKGARRGGGRGQRAAATYVSGKILA